MIKKCLLFTGVATLLVGCSFHQTMVKSKDSISGIYPHLAYYNNEGECGTGAIVPWADRLWVVTYAPHSPFGSSDKLYEITSDYKQKVYSGSIGGTPANRMIHKESNQLFIGPYAINSVGNVRVIPYSKMPGRHTGNARDLFDPTNKICYATMEEGFYSVDVNTLEVDTLFIDGNCKKKKKGDMAQSNDLLPGAHGKGFYSGQGVAVYSNNGEASEEALHKFNVESGVLAEWNGKDWEIVRRNQFVEVTGPGGISGNPNPETDPIWATGWDYKSLIVGVRDAQTGWTFYRLPKASHSYDGAHGWNTEWPRIRNVGTESTPDYLMTMHGMFWRFPAMFAANNSAGIRPRSSYLKVIGDFTRWNDQLVFGCDDSAQKEFLNKRKVKGNIEGPGQSNSNLWFTSLSKPDELGPIDAEGTVWEKENINQGVPSEPFLFGGWDYRSAWIRNDSKETVTYTFEIDKEGNGSWSEMKLVIVEPLGSSTVFFDKKEVGEWIRVKTDKNTRGTINFTYSSRKNKNEDKKKFVGMSRLNDKESIGGLLYGIGENRRCLGVLANKIVNGKNIEEGYYEMENDFRLVKKKDEKTAGFIRDKFLITGNVVSIEKSSVLVVDDSGRRWRLPLGDTAYEPLMNNGQLRVCREVATERDLFSCMGTFYELPAENADGFAKIRPVSTHNLRINDYASYRGMLVLTGVDVRNSVDNEHIVVSEDKKAAVWVGVIDDLWSLGKPVGHGGPWSDSDVEANIPSDPYLIGFYEKRRLSVSNNSDKAINIKIELDPTGSGDWMEYETISLKSKEKLKKELACEVKARWIRFVSDTDANVTTLLDYK